MPVPLWNLGNSRQLHLADKINAPIAPELGELFESAAGTLAMLETQCRTTQSSPCRTSSLSPQHGVKRAGPRLFPVCSRDLDQPFTTCLARLFTCRSCCLARKSLCWKPLPVQALAVSFPVSWSTDFMESLTLPRSSNPTSLTLTSWPSFRTSDGC